MSRPSQRIIKENKKVDDNKALQAKNEELKQLNKTLHDQVEQLTSQLQE